MTKIVKDACETQDQIYQVCENEPNHKVSCIAMPIIAKAVWGHKYRRVWEYWKIKLELWGEVASLAVELARQTLALELV